MSGPTDPQQRGREADDNVIALVRAAVADDMPAMSHVAWQIVDEGAAWDVIADMALFLAATIELMSGITGTPTPVILVKMEAAQRARTRRNTPLFVRPAGAEYHDDSW